MLKYLHNPEFWELDGSLASYVRCSWVILVSIILLSRRFKWPVHRRIFIFAVYSLFMEYVASDDDIQELFGDVGTSPIYHLLTPGLFFFMTQIFSQLIYEGKQKIIGFWLMLIFLIVCVMNMFWVGLSAFPTVPVGLYSTTGIFLSVGYFLSLLNSVEIEFLERTPMFWIATGLLIYFSGNFLVWVGYNFLTYDKDFFFSIYRINTFLTIFLHLFFLIAIMLNPESKKTKTIN